MDLVDHRGRGLRASVALFLLAASFFLPAAASAFIPATHEEGAPRLRLGGELSENSRLGFSERKRHLFLADRGPQVEARLGDTWDVGWELRRTTGDFRNRWYSPELGRWLTPDAIGLAGGMNLYAAFDADPVNRTDPDGTIALVDNAIGGLVSVGVGYGISWWLGEEYNWADAGVDFALGFATSGLSTVAKARHLGKVAKVATVGGGGVALSTAAAVAHDSIHGREVSARSVGTAAAVSVAGGVAGHYVGRAAGRAGRAVAAHLDDWAAEAASGVRLYSFPANFEGSAARAWRSLRRVGSRSSDLALGDDAAEKLLGEYKKVRGHHVHAKSALEGHLTYDPARGLSISQEFLEAMGWSHAKMTAMQRQLFRDLAASGRPNTIFEHNRIAVDALIAGGATREEARALVAASLHNLRAQGVSGPTRIPWTR
jgi:RHS repeat-associated protein